MIQLRGTFVAFSFEESRDRLRRRFFSRHIWFSSRYCRSHLCIARFFLISYLTWVYEFYIFVDDIILHYAWPTTTTFHVGDAFALFITEYSTRRISAREWRRRLMIRKTLFLDATSWLKSTSVELWARPPPSLTSRISALHTNSSIFSSSRIRSCLSRVFWRMFRSGQIVSAFVPPLWNAYCQTNLKTYIRTHSRMYTHTHAHTYADRTRYTNIHASVCSGFT